MHQIKVLIVEDSMVFRQLLADNLEQDPSIKVVATAADPIEAFDAIEKYKPDVMTLDIELPKMNGLEFLHKLIPQHPLPVVVISARSEKVFEALSAGAVDFMAKPSVMDRQQLVDFVQKELIQKIKDVSAAKVGKTGRVVIPQPDCPVLEKNKNLVVAIGASIGGSEAVTSVIQGFGPDVPGVVVVQNMPRGFTELYAERLNAMCSVNVREAKTGDVIRQGQVYIAPAGGMHTRIVKVDGEYQIVCRKGEKVNGHCPSVDVLFQSVAEVAGKNAIGIILTGTGRDGAQGLLAMRQEGARTIGQDESTSVVYGMPKAAFDVGAVEYEEKLSDIARRTYSLLDTF